MPDYQLERSFLRSDKPSEDLLCEDVFPSETRGDGAAVKNNVRTGAAQGKSSLIRKAHCRMCGFPVDLTAVDHSGGSLDGNGAGGAIATSTATYTLSNGQTATENYGQQSYRKNAGCPVCFSKNSTKMRVDVLQNADPWSKKTPLGF